jgi:hypothetical protein
MAVFRKYHWSVRTHTHTHTHTQTPARNTHGRNQGTKTSECYIHRGTVIIIINIGILFLHTSKAWMPIQTSPTCYCCCWTNQIFSGRQTESKVTSALLGWLPWLRTSVLRVPWVFCSVKSGCSGGGSGQVRFFWFGMNESTENPFVGIGTRITGIVKLVFC